ncbi:hypothetical protein GBA52_008423, partial [Prunus armeniaca]
KNPSIKVQTPPNPFRSETIIKPKLALFHRLDPSPYRCLHLHLQGIVAYASSSRVTLALKPFDLSGFGLKSNKHTNTNKTTLSPPLNP